MGSDLPIHRIGIGTDLHRLIAGRPLKLAGVTVPSAHGAIGHSDADVVFHAVTDALLGAAGLPDIGELFPDSDPAFKDADSAELLREAMKRVAGVGLGVAYVDLVIHVERPKLAPHKAHMRNNLACALGVEVSRVNIKAKTNEGMDGVGRGEAIACTAVAALTRMSVGAV